MVKSIEARAIISATDKTGTVLDKIAAKFRGIEKTAKSMEGVKIPKWIDNGDFTKKLQDLNVSERQMNKILRERSRLHDQLWTKENSRPSKLFAPDSQYMKEMGAFQDRTLKHWKNVKRASEEARAAELRYYRSNGMIGTVGSMIGAGGAAYYAGRAGRYAFDRSKEASRETTKQRQSGLTQAQSDAISAEAARQSKAYPTISETEFRSAGREAVMQMGSQEAGMRMMPTIGKFITSGKILWGEDRIEEQTRKALQVLDARQITDPARAESLLNALVKSSQVEGGPDFKADDLRTALRYGRDMTRGQSDRFVTSVLPSLGVDLGYSQAGTGLASMHSALIGGRQKSAADAFQRKVGLRGKDGKLVDQKLFGSEVDRWFDKNYIPTLQKAGIDLDDAAAVAAFNSKFFSNRTAADVAGNFVSGRQQRVKRDEQQKQAKGMEGAETIHRRDVGAALEAVSSQLTNVASSAKLAEASIAGLNNAMALIQQAGEKFNEPGGWFDRGKKQFEQEQSDFDAVTGAAKRVLDFDKSTTETVQGWIYGRSANRSTRMGGGGGGSGAAGSAPWPSSAAAVPFASGGPNASFLPAATTWSDYFNVGSGRLGKGKRLVPPSFTVPGVSDSTTYGTGAPGDRTATSVTVEGTMQGEGKLTIEISAPSVLEVVRRAEAVLKMAGQINTNGPGSTGRSSPDAEAP